MEDQLELPKSTPLFGKRRFWIWILIVGVVSVSLFLLYTSEIIPRQVLNAVPEFADKHAEEGVLITASQQNSSENGIFSSGLQTDGAETEYYSPSPEKHRLCTVRDYPVRFELDTNSTDKLAHYIVLEACTTEILTIRAIGANGQNVDCEPWANMYGRIVGPDLDKYPRSKEYSLYFNKVDVSYVNGGNFSVKVPPLEPGEYRLEILLVHKEDARELVYNTLQKVPCLDAPLVNTPAAITVVDHGKCAKRPRRTPLCTSGEEPGRWVTVPKSGCDGALCEGNIDILSSSRRVWAPYDCHYKMYGPEDLTQCFAGKNILFIGDSITEEITNEILQIYYYTPPKPPLMKSTMLKEKKWVGRPSHWSQILSGGSRVGFSFVMATPLGCGISCVTGKTDSQLENLLTPYGKVDLLVLLTGLHDACPRNKPYFFDVFGEYSSQLQPFEAKLRNLISKDGRIIWLNSPEGSDTSRCDYLSKPRLEKMNNITKEFLSTRKDISLLDYFEISGSCYCGNIHKGIRFFKASDAQRQYNGFVSRMVAHIIMNMYCNSPTKP